MSMMLLFGGEVSPAYDLNFMGGMPAGLTHTNSSTERVYWDSTGTRRSAVANEPIFETLGGVAQGLRWEMEARSNLATNSEGAAATWTVLNVVDAATPIAGFSASLLFGDNSAGRSSYKTAPLTLGVAYTVSVFVQMNDGLAPSVGTNATTGDFCLVSDGLNHSATATVQRIAGNIYRVWSARTSTIGGAARNCGVAKYVGQSARSFRIAGIQVEAAASASSYIPTAGSAVIRQPDVLTASSISPWYNQSEGTVVFEGIASTPATAQRGMYLFSDGTDNERISGYRASGLNGGALVVDGGVTQADISTLSAIAQASIFRHALAYKLNNVAGSVNGGAPVVDTSATMPTITGLTLGQGNTAGTQAFMGYARRLSYYNTRLPDAILQGLSRV
ncbi:MAG: hypothetical protein ABFE07_15315 [Armatimonadia bacterium]